MVRVTPEDIRRARRNKERQDTGDRPQEPQRQRVRVERAAVERAHLRQILDRIKPSNFHHGQRVGVRIMSFVFNAPRTKYEYELRVNGRRHRAKRRDAIAIVFEGARLDTGQNELELAIAGHREDARSFTIHYHFEDAPYFGRCDPVTQQELTADDIVVRCRVCHTYSLRSSWSSRQGPCPCMSLPSSRCENRDQGFFDSTEQGFSTFHEVP